MILYLSQSTQRWDIPQALPSRLLCKKTHGGWLFADLRAKCTPHSAESNTFKHCRAALFAKKHVAGGCLLISGQNAPQTQLN